jgi:hypothetical protein
MFDSYRVEARHLGYLQERVSHPIDLPQFDYFVECYAEDAETDRASDGRTG